MPPCTVWVGRIPSSAHETTLRQCFSEYGYVSLLTLRKKEGERKNWAFVTYETADAVATLMDAVHTVGVEVTVGQEAFALQVEFPQMKDLHSSGASALQTNGASSGGAQQARSRLQMQRRWALLRQDVSFVFGKKRGQDLAMASFRQMVAGSAEALHMDSQHGLEAEERCCFFSPVSHPCYCTASRRATLQPLFEYSFVSTWKSVQMCMLVYIAFLYPLREGFVLHVEVGTTMFFVDLVVDVWFVLDIFVNFRTAFRDESDVLTIDSKIIVRRYMRGWFCVDLVSCLPVNYILLAIESRTRGQLDPGHEDTSSTHTSGLVLKCLKVARLARLLRLLKLKSLKDLMAKYEDTKVHDMLEGARAGMLGMVLLWIVHVLCCFWYYIGTLTQPRPDGADIYGWVVYDFGKPGDRSRPVSSIWRRYLFSFHAVNPKMFDLSTDGEFTDYMIVTSILLETAGMIVFGVIVETLSSLIKSGKLGEQVLREKMDMLREFFRMRDITVSTRRKVRLFYENMYKHRSVWDESEILKPLPAVLQKELVRDMYKHMDQTTLFAGLDADIRTKLCTLMRPMHATVGCEVMKEGEVAMELFIVMSGEVLMQRAGQDVATLRLGECFGEAEMLGRGMGVHGNLRAYSAVAKTRCDLCFLERDPLLELMQMYPLLRKRLSQLDARAEWRESFGGKKPRAKMTPARRPRTSTAPAAAAKYRMDADSPDQHRHQPSPRTPAASPVRGRGGDSSSGSGSDSGSDCSASVAAVALPPAVAVAIGRLGSAMAARLDELEKRQEEKATALDNKLNQLLHLVTDMAHARAPPSLLL